MQNDQSRETGPVNAGALDSDSNPASVVPASKDVASEAPAEHSLDAAADHPQASEDVTQSVPSGVETTVAASKPAEAVSEGKDVVAETPADHSPDAATDHPQAPEAVPSGAVTAVAEGDADLVRPVSAEKELQTEIDDIRTGKSSRDGVEEEKLLPLCRVIDYWLADETEGTIERLGLGQLAQEIKRDYVLASLLAWRGDYKLVYISLRSFLESFCLLLYYLNQGCDRLLYLKGQGYKLMLHKMAQKRQPDDTHAFRRHYHLLISESSALGDKAANSFFDEIDSCYDFLSKSVHGDNATKSAGCDKKLAFVDILERVLRICNTLALHDPMLDATEEDLTTALGTVLSPTVFEWKPK